jgi:hypothetical protein
LELKFKLLRRLLFLIVPANIMNWSYPILTLDRVSLHRFGFDIK